MRVPSMLFLNLIRNIMPNPPPAGAPLGTSGPREHSHESKVTFFRQLAIHSCGAVS
jgi:hypothetical protein